MSLPSPALLLRSCRPPLCSLKNVSRETFVRGVGPHRALGSALAEQGPRWVSEGALRNGSSQHPCEASRRRLRAKPKTKEALLPRCSSSRLPGTAPSPPFHPDRGSERPSRRPPISRAERPRSDPEAAGSPEVRNPSPASLTASAASSLSPFSTPLQPKARPRKRRLRIARSPRRRTAAASNGKRRQTRAARGQHPLACTPRTAHDPRAARPSQTPARARRAPSARKPPSPAPSQTPRCKRSAPRGSCRCPACPRR